MATGSALVKAERSRAGKSTGKAAKSAKTRPKKEPMSFAGTWGTSPHAPQILERNPRKTETNAQHGKGAKWDQIYRASYQIYRASNHEVSQPAAATQPVMLMRTKLDVPGHFWGSGGTSPWSQRHPAAPPCKKQQKSYKRSLKASCQVNACVAGSRNQRHNTNEARNHRRPQQARNSKPNPQSKPQSEQHVQRTRVCTTTTKTAVTTSYKKHGTVSRPNPQSK